MWAKSCARVEGTSSSIFKVLICLPIPFYFFGGVEIKCILIFNLFFFPFPSPFPFPLSKQTNKQKTKSEKNECWKWMCSVCKVVSVSLVCLSSLFHKEKKWFQVVVDFWEPISVFQLVAFVYFPMELKGINSSLKTFSI